MDEFLSYIFRNQWVVFILPALLLMGIADLGFRFGLRLYASQDEASDLRAGRRCSEILIDLMYDLSSASMAADAEQVLSQQWKQYEKLIADVCAAPAKQTE